MTLRERLEAIVAALPEGGSAVLPVVHLREWLAAEQGGPPAPAVADPDDEVMTASEVAGLLKVTPRWVYDHAKRLGGRKLSRKCTRFSRRAVLAELARRR